jgi:hypothetical protein
MYSAAAGTHRIQNSELRMDNDDVGNRFLRIFSSPYIEKTHPHLHHISKDLASPLLTSLVELPKEIGSKAPVEQVQTQSFVAEDDSTAYCDPR